MKTKFEDGIFKTDHSSLPKLWKPFFEKEDKKVRRKLDNLNSKIDYPSSKNEEQDVDNLLLKLKSGLENLKKWEDYVKSVLGYDLTGSEIEKLFKTYIPTGKIIEEMYFYDDATLYYTNIPWPFTNIEKDVYLNVYEAIPNEWINNEMGNDTWNSDEYEPTPC